MKPLQELLKGKVVNCQTEEEAKEFLSFMHENGYKWMAGNSLIEKNYWAVNGMDSCYYCSVESKDLEYGHKRYVEKDKFKVITYQQFKRLINNEDMEIKEAKSYTLDELKSEVDKFRNYLLKVCGKNECAINVEFEYNETISTFSAKSIGIETKISIF